MVKSLSSMNVRTYVRKKRYLLKYFFAMVKVLPKDFLVPYTPYIILNTSTVSNWNQKIIKVKWWYRYGKILELYECTYVCTQKMYLLKYFFAMVKVLLKDFLVPYTPYIILNIESTVLS